MAVWTAKQFGKNRFAGYDSNVSGVIKLHAAFCHDGLTLKPSSINRRAISTAL
jgi:hypothetical protein